MNPPRSRRRWVACAAVLVAAAGGLAAPAGAAAPAQADSGDLVRTYATKSEIWFTVPSGYRTVRVEAVGGGAGGGGGRAGEPGTAGGGGGGGGGGAYVACTLTLKYHSKMYVRVGGGGSEVTGGIDGSGTNGWDGSNSEVMLDGTYRANADRGRAGSGGPSRFGWGGNGGGPGEVGRSYCDGSGPELTAGRSGNDGTGGNGGGSSGGVGGASPGANGCPERAGHGGSGGAGGAGREDGGHGNAGEEGCVILTFRP
ncbi:glycine-rich domain-containing protein [Streptomyces scopuliridis]|uniref:glycine-rich domain-containing protein n=1 Tax=Streptomyces scopuliridis TaxID=452529 RepID=UPI00406BC7E3